MTTTPTPQSLLKTVYGYDEFRPMQREVIQNVLNKRDTLAIMPTGGGKSLCYQIPALLFPGLTVVVSPLIALMKDQVGQLIQLGVPALFLNSSLSFPEYQKNVAQVKAGRIKLLYVAPETLLLPRTLALLDGLRLDCLTIDEAHCISEWGHDFRPEYRQLVEARNRFPQATCLALTATATRRVRADIQSTLRFEAQNEFVASFNRDNLLIEVTPKHDAATQTVEFLKRFRGQSGIIYCFSRRQVDELADLLALKGFSARPYHAGLSDEERCRNQDAFIRDDVQIIVATIAFGMGINKPNVRFVIHYDLPKSIESYYQEIGRAGRDGLPSHCLLLYSYSDAMKLRYFIDKKEAREREVAYQHLDALTRYAESEVCRRGPLLHYFGEDYIIENCGMCDVCLSSARDELDVTIPAQKFLSCVKRTGERFGANHVVDVLLGSENKRVLQFGHQELSTYGIGKDLTREQWLHLGRQLVAKGYLALEGEYRTLSLTLKAYEALKNRQSIFGVLEDARPAVTKKAARVSEHDDELFELLRQKRKALADKMGVPPYVIFSDRTLSEFASYFPQTPESLRAISGVGEIKAERFGGIFLQEIVLYCRERGLKEKPVPGKRERKSGSDNPRRYLQVAADYNAGVSIVELAGRYGVQPGTIIEHLVCYSTDGNRLRMGDDLQLTCTVSPELQQAALSAFEELGAEKLKPVFDRLGEAVSYDDLKILRMRYLAARMGSEEA